MNLNISDKLKELRISSGMTQKELAEKLHVSFQSVSKWELGKSLPSLESLIELSNIYNVSIEDILGIKRPKSRKGLIKILDNLNKKLEETRFEYIIVFKDKKTKINVEDYPKLRSLGIWTKDSGRALKVHSKMKREEIVEVLSLETGIDSDEITITSQIDLYGMQF